MRGGALQEKANTAMQKVIENMQDPNTPWKNQRQINIRIAFVQNEDRDDVAVAVSVDTKLAPVTPVLTRMAVGKDIRSGKVYAQEYGRQIKGQMSLDLGQQEPGTLVQVDGDLVDRETGEIIEDKVVDLRRAVL
ncbi:MAG: hypothetical protein K2P22_02210 [Lachnospiraceae bacterium]|nr:hypothetical protein [Lachnospiraceae bacterium]